MVCLIPGLVPHDCREHTRFRGEVILAFQLPFAIVPLVLFTRDKAKMGRFVAPRWLTLVAALTAAIIICLNGKLLWDLFSG